MAIGPVVTAGVLSARASQLAKAWRQLAFETGNFHAEVVKLGHNGLAGLPGGGFDATPGSWPVADGGDGIKDEADRFAYLIDVMGTLADIHAGTVGQAAPFSFDDALTILCGP